MERTTLVASCLLALTIGSAWLQAADTLEHAASRAPSANQTSFASLSTQLSQFESRLAACEDSGQIVHATEAAYGCESEFECCDCGWAWWTNPCCGLTGMAEGVWLRAHDSEDAGDNRFHDGSRLTIGYLNDCGQEWRVRLFELGIDSDDAGFYNLSTVDVEYAGRFQWGCNWAGDISLGLRYADYHEQGDNDYDETIGPVIGLHLKSAPLWHDLNAFTTLRYSQQFGTDRADAQHGSFSITEAQIGLELWRETCCGTTFVRGFLEAQNWMGVEDDDSEDLGLMGLGFSLGLSR